MSCSNPAIALLLTVAGVCCAANADSASPCDVYGANVTVHGVLSRETFPEQPNFESSAAGDVPASYFFVTPDTPICVDESRNDPSAFTGRLQLVFAAGHDAYAPLRPSLARTVVCHGSPMHAMSGHHHSPVLLIDARCDPAITATSASLGRHLRRDGAKEVLAELRQQPAVFEATLDGITNATPAWLAVAQQLLEVADGSDAEGLQMALARGLPHHPSAVLALARHDVALEQLCTSPFIEPAPGIATDYAHRAVRALATVRDPALRPLARLCADRIGRLPADT